MRRSTALHTAMPLTAALLMATLPGCRLDVDLGSPGAARRGEIALVAEETDVTLPERGPINLVATAGGEVLACGERQCVAMSAAKVTRVLDFSELGRMEHVAAPATLPGQLVVGNENGLFACVLEGAHTPMCSAQIAVSGGALPSAFRPETPVFGLTPFGGGLLFATPNGVGAWSATPNTPQRIARYYEGSAFTAEAPIVGATRAVGWLALARPPYACKLDRLPDDTPTPITCQGPLSLPAPITQAATLSDGRVAFATAGLGVVIFDGESSESWNSASGLPSERVSDVIVWQGALWAATEKGLARYDANKATTDVPAGALAETPILALAVTADGSLAILAGRRPPRLYRVRPAG